MSEHIIHSSVFTIGHSDHSYDDFLGLLRKHQITAIADVRSSPYSRRSPHFNREALRDELSADGVSYVFLGGELGGRPKDNSLFRRGAANYEAMAEQPAFKIGIERVVKGIEKYNIALMCSEKHPLECHRCLLVGRALKDSGIEVIHIFSDGGTIDHSILEEELLSLVYDERTIQAIPRDFRLREAYREQAARVAYPQPREKSSSLPGLI